jgi:hypothetical protein
MSIECNHTIVWSRDSRASAAFLVGNVIKASNGKWRGLDRQCAFLGFRILR